MSFSRTQHDGGRFRTPDLSLRSPTTALLGSLIRSFVVVCLDTAAPLDFIEITGQAGLLETYLVRHPKKDNLERELNGFQV